MMVEAAEADEKELALDAQCRPRLDQTCRLLELVGHV